MPYADASYAMGMPQMPSTAATGYGGDLPSIANQQTMSTRTSRSSSLIRPGSGAEDNRRSLSTLEFANGRMNFNDFRPDGVPNGYAQPPNQNASAVADANPHYNNFEHAAASNAMTQNNMPVKSEAADAASYGVATLPNADGSMSNGQDASSLWRNGTFNGESQLMNSSTAGGPYQSKSTGVLTGTF